MLRPGGKARAAVEIGNTVHDSEGLGEHRLHHTGLDFV